PVLGLEIDTGPDIDWRRDYTRHIASGTAYARTIPFLDASRVGDHKVVWELNRHQHLVVLAQAACVTGREDFVREVERELKSWWVANPYVRGINWASALEVAMRALSWMWVSHLLRNRLDSDVHVRLWTELYRHGSYLERNLSIYFSPNTHLLIEAVGL